MPTNPERAVPWMRTLHFVQTLALAEALDGTRTVPQAAQAINIGVKTAYRVMAMLRVSAQQFPDMVQIARERRGRHVYYWVDIVV